MRKLLFYLLFFPITIILSNPPKAKGLKLIANDDANSATQRLAVVVGLNDYTDKNISQLNKARYDAKLFAKTLQEYGQFDQVSLLTDDNDARGIEYPNKKNIETKIEVILSKANPEDFFLFYFSGHGEFKDDEMYLILNDYQNSRLRTTSISGTELDDQIRSLNR